MNPKQALYGLLALAALHGAGTEFYLSRNLQPSSAFTLLITALFIVLCYLWYFSDASQRSFRRTNLHGSLVVLLPPVGVLYYILRSRPKPQRLRSAFKAAAFFLLFLVISVATGIALQVAR